MGWVWMAQAATVEATAMANDGRIMPSEFGVLFLFQIDTNDSFVILLNGLMLLLFLI